MTGPGSFVVLLSQTIMKFKKRVNFLSVSLKEKGTVYLVRAVLLMSLLSETDGRQGSQFHPGFPAGRR